MLFSNVFLYVFFVRKQFPTSYTSNATALMHALAIVLCSVVTISTITFWPFMLLLHMIHRSVGQFRSKFTFSAELSSSNRILKELIQIGVGGDEDL